MVALERLSVSLAMLVWAQLRGIVHEHLPRLPAESYRGFAFVHWIMTVEQRHTGWLDDRVYLRLREVLLHTTTKYHLLCPVYCVMPDHLHMLWLGISDGSDQRLAAQFFRKWTNPLLGLRAWQKQAYDHVLREDERKEKAFESICDYILLNPVRAKLVEHKSQYAFSGAMIPGYPGLDPNAPEYWEKFWKIYYRFTGRADLK